jgi:hypothetical protein
MCDNETFGEKLSKRYKNNNYVSTYDVKEIFEKIFKEFLELGFNYCYIDNDDFYSRFSNKLQAYASIEWIKTQNITVDYIENKIKLTISV